MFLLYYYKSRTVVEYVATVITTRITAKSVNYFCVLY